MESVLFLFSLIMSLLVTKLVKSGFARKWKIMVGISLVYFVFILLFGISGLCNNFGFTAAEKTSLYLIFCMVYIILATLVFVILTLVGDKTNPGNDSPGSMATAQSEAGKLEEQ